MVVRALLLCGLIAAVVRFNHPAGMAAEVESPAPENSRQSAPAADSPEAADTPAGANADRLREFEAVMDRYYRDDPLATARQQLKDKIQQYNQWAETAHAQNKAAVAELNTQVESLQALDALTNEMDKKLEQKPDLGDKPAVDAYNASVEERNQRVREYNELAKVHEKDKQAYQSASEQFDRQAETRKADLEALQQDFEREIEAHRQWFTNGKDLDLFKDLNRFFARLHDEQPNGDTPERAGMLDRVRSIRRELFEHTVAHHERMETGAVVVEARLCGRESCFLLVDTGAMSVTVPMSLVEALALTDQLGKEISVAVAGGGRVPGRELTIPQVAVQGHEAEDVRAIVLDEFDAGVDGLLGLSYLKQFAIRIDPKRPEKLVIRPTPEE